MKYITSNQMTKVDDLAVNKYGIKIEQMMENAGRNLANFVSKLNPKSVLIMFGKGNNGGGGLVAARHLLIKGINVKIISPSKNLNKIVENQLKIIKKLNVKEVKKINNEEIIIDALLGYNIKGNPKTKFAELIKKANKAKEKGSKIISLDIPSGINPDNGEKYSPYIQADYTLTLALPKIGLKKIKKVFLVNIGIPNKIYLDIGIKIKNYFKNKDIIKIKEGN